MISLGTVNISNKTKDLMKQALDKGVIGQGDYIKEFEERLAGFFKVKHAVAVANGTLADACALAAAKYEDGCQRKEVIVPALTFISQINAIYYNQLKPVFVDVDYDYQINTEKIEEKINKNTLAIMPTHLLGWSAEMGKILSLAKKYNLYVIEDACEALGSRYQNQLCGTIGDMGCFSFFPSHTISTGEGGVIVTNNDKLASLLRLLRNNGRKSERPEDKFIFPSIGFSAKMNALEATIGLGVIDELPQHIKRRHQNMIKLNTLLGKNCFSEEGERYTVPHAYPITVESKEIRDKLLRLLPEEFGIEARQIFYSIPTQSEAYKFLEEKEGAYLTAEDIGRRGLYVPCHQNLSEEDIIKVSNTLKRIIKNE